MRISDWSSDVCSSDLNTSAASPEHARPYLDMGLPVFPHSACLEHDTGAGHFERPQRLGAVIDALRTGVADDIDWREAPGATRGQLLRVHDASLLEAVLETRSAQPVELDADTMLSPQSAEAALRAAGAGVAAVDAVMADEASSAFCAEIGRASGREKGGQYV